jgi:hypothetical protein
VPPGAAFVSLTWALGLLAALVLAVLAWQA